MGYQLTCVIPGSYRRFLDDIVRDVIPVFESAGIEVLYPLKAQAVNPGAEYIIFDKDPEPGDPTIDPYNSAVLPVDEGDLLEYARLTGTRIEEMERIVYLEQGFMRALEEADIIYLWNPGGYIGDGTAHEIGAFNKPSENRPIFSLEPVSLELASINPVSAMFLRNAIRTRGGVYAPEDVVKHLHQTGRLKTTENVA